MKKNELKILLLGLVYCLTGFTLFGQTKSSREDIVKRSEVVLFHSPSVGNLSDALFIDYNASWTGWGYGYGSWQINNHHIYGVKFTAGISAGNMRSDHVEQNGLLDAVCLDLNGEYINSVGTGFLGLSFYRMCINDPLWQNHLRTSVEQAIANGTDGIKFDTPCGSPGHPQVYWTGAGCSCEHCMAMFRSHLNLSYDSLELVELGITDIINFDYFQDIVKQYASTRQEYQNQFNAIPLLREFIMAQMVSAKNIITGIAEYGKSLNETTMITTNAWHLFPYNLYMTEFAQHVVAEMPYGAEYDNKWTTGEFGKIISHTNKLGEFYELPLFVTATIDDWKNFQNWDDADPNNDLINLSKLWIASTYATGAHFMVPTNYDWTSNNYFGKFSDYGPVYNFITDNNKLFDGFEGSKKVAVLFDNAAAYSFRFENNVKTNNYLHSYHNICGMLTNNQVPWGVVVAGGGLFINDTLDRSWIESEYELLVVPEDYSLLHGQNQIVDDMVAAGTAIYWDDSSGSIEDIHSLVDPVIEVDSLGDLWIVPRESEDAEDPLILHLISKKYSKSNDQVTIQNDISISVNKELLNGKDIKSVIIHSPGSEKTVVSFTEDAETIEFTVPELHYWGIVELDTAFHEISSIQDMETPSGLKVYPNPSTGKFQIETTEEGTARIFDGRGRLVRSFQIRPGITHLNTSDLDPGIYTIILKSMNRRLLLI